MKLPGREDMLDTAGRPITQSLFLEMGYTDSSVYTLKDRDYDYKGTTYPSIKKLYLELEDPTEYNFATKYLLGWNHWQRLVDNKAIRVHIDEWRNELELKLRSRAVQQMLELASIGKIQAAQWVANKGWTKRIAGRPSKQELDSEKAFQTKVGEEYSADVVRLRTG